MTCNKSRYTFSRLTGQEFRLLIVEPAADHNDALKCRMTTSSHFSGSYDAISWSWGDPREREERASLLIDGSLFDIPGRLHTALLALRSKADERAFWVDAVCIDMTNLEEHNHQVLLMRKIFEGAAGVSVWLGEGDETSGEAMAFIRRVCKARDLDDVIRGDRYKQSWASLMALMLRPWFLRCWVFQEIAVARRATVVCGADSVDWADFEACVSLLEKRGRIYPDTLQVGALRTIQLVETVRDSFDRRGGGGIVAPRLTLQELVIRLSFLRATDFHDQIYSLLGVAKDAENYPQPDYSLSVLETYEEFIRHSIKTTGSLDIIFRPLAPESLREFLPAWIRTTGDGVYSVYDGSTGISVARLAGDLFVGNPGSPPTYAASGKREASNFDKAAEDGLAALNCRGFFVDTIKTTARPAHSGKIPREWFDLGIGSSTKMPTDFWKTLVADRDNNGKRPAPSVEAFLEQSLLRSTSGSGGVSDLNHLIENQSSSTGTRILSRVRDVVFGRSLVKTKAHGFLGLAPAVASEGDMICVLHGSSVPVVLRARSGGYQLIGECYIHGIMDGQAADLNNGNNPERLYTILSPRAEEEEEVALARKIADPMMLTSSPIFTSIIPDIAIPSETIDLGKQLKVSDTQSTSMIAAPQFFWRQYRIYWTCNCGHVGHDDVAELNPGTVDEMVDALRGHSATIRLEKVERSNPFVAVWREFWLLISELALNLLNDWRYLVTAGTSETPIRSSEIATGQPRQATKIKAVHTTIQADEAASEMFQTPAVSLRQMNFSGEISLASSSQDESEDEGMELGVSASTSDHADAGTRSNMAVPVQGGAATQPAPLNAPRSAQGATSAHVPLPPVKRQARAAISGGRARGSGQGTQSQSVHHHTYHLALFVDYSRYLRKMLEVEVTNKKKERDLFNAIRTAYQAEKGLRRWWPWLSVRGVVALNFVKFTHISRLPPTYEVDNVQDPDVPPPAERRYEMRPNPPMSVPPHDPRRFMMHRFSSSRNCDLDSEDTWDHVPKRKDGKPSDDDGSVWGLYVIEGTDERYVATWVGLLCVFTIVFSAIWASFNGVQDAFAMGAWTFAMGTVTLVPIQISIALLGR